MFKPFKSTISFSITWCLIILIGGCGVKTKSQLSTARIFTDHMVLQRNQKVTVWGWTKPNATVKVKFNGQELSTKADGIGNWKAVLKPMKAGGPYVMYISSGKDLIKYKDVMMGEVWLCAGQSNMQFPLGNTKDYQQELNEIKLLNIRQFKVPQRMSLAPDERLSGGKWIKASSNTIADFSAVGYYFSKQIAQQLNVTVGIINSSWETSHAESWISKGALLKSGEFKDAAEQQPDNWKAIRRNIDQALKVYTYNGKAVKSYKVDQLAHKPAHFFDSWTKGNLGAWKWQYKLTNFRGTGFMQRSVTLDSAHVRIPSTLSLGKTDANIKLFINGEEIFNGALAKGNQIRLPAGTWKVGKNSLLLQLLSDQRDPWWFGFGINGDEKNTFLKFSADTIGLADHEWRIMPDFSKPYYIKTLPTNTVSTLYNGMINPLRQLSVAGVVWYQGESNLERAFQYRKAFPMLINSWRQEWKTNLPFIFAQLASFGSNHKNSQGSVGAELREAQSMALCLKNTGMAVTYDVGDSTNILPVDKSTVGFRLASVVLNRYYHFSEFLISPLFKSVAFQSGYASVKFITMGQKLKIKKNEKHLIGFQLAGADHVFFNAKAEIVNNEVKVWCDQVQQPVAVRYAWSNSPVNANLFVEGEIPVAPFRSDDFPYLTEGRQLTLYSLN